MISKFKALHAASEAAPYASSEALSSLARPPLSPKRVSFSAVWCSMQPSTDMTTASSEQPPASHSGAHPDPAPPGSAAARRSANSDTFLPPSRCFENEAAYAKSAAARCCRKERQSACSSRPLAACFCSAASVLACAADQPEKCSRRVVSACSSVRKADALRAHWAERRASASVRATSTIIHGCASPSCDLTSLVVIAAFMTADGGGGVRHEPVAARTAAPPA
mmetsp:Transcript_13577/g.43441  ORF Transcript_13577/g.43441 Transcript_13577/m.43441 type:complete len:223 (+) Transcript_13577:564-1232(+)